LSTLLSKRRARGSNGTLAICVFAAVTVASATWTAEARANPFGYREHDGFYLRLSGGAGALAVDRSTESEGPQNSLVYGDSSSVGGTSIFAELSIGGTPFRRVVVAGTLLGNNLPAAGLELASGSRLSLGSPLWFAFLGPTVDIFPVVSGGFHIGAGAGWAVATAGVQQDRLFDTFGGGGIGATLSGGYDAWVSDDWSVGVIVRAVLARIRGEQQSSTVVGREYDTVSSLSIAATALFH
jgi:hypothetical protein